MRYENPEFFGHKNTDNNNFLKNYEKLKVGSKYQNNLKNKETVNSTSCVDQLMEPSHYKDTKDKIIGLD